MSHTVFRWTLLVSLITVSISFAALSGRLTAHHVDDTSSYLQYPFDSLPAALNSQRTPVYPVFLKAVLAVGSEAVVPTIQWLIVSLAAWWLASELLYWSASRSTATACCVAIVFGCTSIDNQSTLATDALAASLGVMTVAAMLQWIRWGRSVGGGALLVVLTIAAIMTRPAYLPLVPWILLIGTWIKHSPTMSKNTQGLNATESVDQHGPRSRLFRSAVVVGCIVALIIAWMGLRKVVVDDFGLLPFGHQNLAGLTIQLIDDEQLIRTAAESGEADLSEFVQLILAHRQTANQHGFDFVPGGRLPTMKMESQWNDLIYHAVVPAANQMFPNDPVAAHNIIGDLNKAVIGSHPIDYLRWITLGMRRALWGVPVDILMNPFFIAAIAAFGLWWLSTVVAFPYWERLPTTAVATCGMSRATGIVAVIAISYALLMVMFVLLSSPPIGRFVDAACIFVPAWLAMWATEVTLRRH